LRRRYEMRLWHAADDARFYWPDECTGVLAI
jgi:hypothetical protein